MRSLLLPILAAAALGACTKAKTEVPSGDRGKTTVLAVVNGEVITAGDLESALGPDYRKRERDLFEQKRQTLESLVVRKLALAEAKKTGVSEDDFLKQYVDAKVVSPTELDARAFYDKSPQLMGGQPFEAVKDKILEYLRRQREQQVAQTLFKQLRAGAKVDIKLVEPAGMRVSVAAVGPARGPKDAPVTIVEFSDFQCPYCGRAAKTVDKLVADYAGKVRLVFRDFPLQSHDKAPKAAEAGRCANEQGKFWEMHDQMFDNQQRLEGTDLKKYARDIGLDSGKFDECLESGKFAGAVKDDLADGEKAGVSGTPAFFVNGRMLSGALPYEEFQSAVEQELARAAAN